MPPFPENTAFTSFTLKLSKIISTSTDSNANFAYARSAVQRTTGQPSGVIISQSL